MQKGLAVIVALLVVTAWQYRKNRPLLFVMIATLFGACALVVASRSTWPEWILKSLAIGWLVCMLIAGVLSAMKLLNHARKRTKLS
jgi:peptidoglycan/LPS O-acetylase OafA/YrhL